MKTLYKNTPRIAAAIVATLVVSTGAALAVTRDVTPALPVVEAAYVGRFVITPTSMKHVAPVQVVGRFVISQHSAAFMPAVTA